MDSSFSDPTITAVLIALAMVLSETIKLLVSWTAKKIKKDKGEEVQTLEVSLDPEVSRMIYEMSQQMRDVHNTMSKSDHEGVPMVYSSRADAQNLKMVVDVMKELSSFQQRLAVLSERLDNRLEKRDKDDALVFDRMENILIRIDQMARENRDNIKDVMRAFDSHDRKFQLISSDISEIKDKM